MPTRIAPIPPRTMRSTYILGIGLELSFRNSFLKNDRILFIVSMLSQAPAFVCCEAAKFDCLEIECFSGCKYRFKLATPWLNVQSPFYGSRILRIWIKGK